MLERLFGKKRDDGGAARLQAAMTGYRADVIEAAERKLGRSLTQDERSGIERIASLMMLESCYQTFSSDGATPERVQTDVSYFASATTPSENA